MGISSILCLIICSCSGGPSQKEAGSQLSFSTIAIVTPEDVIALGGAKTKSSRAGKGITYGSAGGATGGAMVGALACGPYFYGICVVGMSAAGMIAGGTAGALYGFSGVSEEESLYIIEEMTHLGHTRDFQQELASGVESRLPEEIVSTPKLSSAQAIAKVHSIDFVGGKNDSVYLKVSATVSIVTRVTGNDFAEYQRNISMRSRDAHLDDWLRVDSQKFGEAVDECLDGLIIEITQIIMKHHNPSARPA